MIDKLNTDIKSAMKAKDKVTLTALRGIKSEACNIALADKRKDVTSEDILSSVTKGIKQRKDSVDEYIKCDRSDLADIELSEIKVLEGFLPQQLTDEEITTLVTETISTLGNPSIKEMGKVMGALSKKIEKGTADMKKVMAVVKSNLC